MIFIVDDDLEMAGCDKRVVGDSAEVRIFANGIEAMSVIAEGELPDLIFLDILLDGPDGFTFLHELVSYSDTRKIPVVIISSLDFSGRDLADYGVVGILEKEKMRPEEIFEYVKKYAG